MALEFRWEETDEQKVLLKLDFEEWELLETQLEAYRVRTGFWLDLYSDSKISPERSRSLAQMLEVVENPTPQILSLSRILRSAYKSNRWLIAMGD